MQSQIRGHRGPFTGSKDNLYAKALLTHPPFLDVLGIRRGLDLLLLFVFFCSELRVKSYAPLPSRRGVQNKLLLGRVGATRRLPRGQSPSVKHRAKVTPGQRRARVNTLLYLPQAEGSVVPPLRPLNSPSAPTSNVERDATFMRRGPSQAEGPRPWTRAARRHASLTVGPPLVGLEGLTVLQRASRVLSLLGLAPRHGASL